MNESLLEEVLLSGRFQSELAKASRLAVLSDLPAIEAADEREGVDWSFALLCCSLLTASETEESQDAVLRVTQACLVSEGSSGEERGAAALLLERLGNAPAVKLAKERGMIPDEVWAESSGPLGLDVIRSRLELTVPVAGGVSLRVNRFQREFWSAARSNEWLSVSAPTSAGKSFIVRQWIEDAITSSSGTYRSVYLVPTRALIQEVSGELQAQFGDAVGVYTLPWDAAIGTQDKEIFVLTQERLHLLQHQDSEFSADLTFIDEAQKFGDDARGVLLQRVLDESVSRSATSQVLFASPLSENPGLLLESAPDQVSTDALPGGTVTVSQNLFWVNQVKGYPRRWAVDIMLPDRSEAVGEVLLEARPSPASKRLPLLAVALGRDSASNVIYVNGAADAEKAARQVYEAVGEGAYVGDDPGVIALRELSQKTIHESYALNTCLERGVAFHYGNMPLLIRIEIERLFRSGILRYLVCTSTLLEGVNLPCRNLFVRGPRRGRGRPMSAPDFWNLAGRAGRWGKEFQGNIFCIDTTDEKQWPTAPTRRVRYPLRRATDDVMSDPESLIAYIEGGTQPDEGQGAPPLESVFSFLAARSVEGESINDLPGVERLDPATQEELEEAVRLSLTSVEIPPTLIRRHAGISPVSMQRLLDDFRDHADTDSLMISPPESSDAVETIVSAFGRLRRTIGGNLGPPARQFMLALLVVHWMRGAPLARIIADRLRYLEERDRPYRTQNVIRECMSDVEQIARFEAPKLLACYLDVLRFHLAALGLEDQMGELPDVAMLLELGVSRTTELSLVTLGLSRTSAISLSEYIVEDELAPVGCVAWLRSAELESLDLPELVRIEIRSMLERQPYPEQDVS